MNDVIGSLEKLLDTSNNYKNLLEKYSIPYGAEILHTNNTKVDPGTLIAKWDPLTLPIISEQEGTIVFADLTEDVTMKVDIDELTGSTKREVIDINERPLKGKGMTPTISVLNDKKKALATYTLPSKSMMVRFHSN